MSLLHLGCCRNNPTKKPKEIDLAHYNYHPAFLCSVANEKTGDNLAFTYYGDGLSPTKVENGNETKYVYLNGKVIEELDGEGNVKARNIWGNELLYRKDYSSSKGGYFGYNSHGDVVSISDADGNDLNTYDYDSWGNIVSQTEGMSNPFKYRGEMYDDKTEFYYLRAPYYDPKLGVLFQWIRIRGKWTIHLVRIGIRMFLIIR
ncbi:RHS repeat-associated core domain-containing protein [Brevibacillus nitrificans]|uniref:RHS repeat domain-containing protein n=1 Tax=Brevibacillus nitrificans TaxID=651560 RepID=UPI0028676D3A|nr:RHS repeat-associated core domain-containing protein [Brevibacillus nitrificans]MDR7313783.1 YD repeat-containing protein [Brevibacillus nitrificans]